MFKQSLLTLILLVTLGLSACSGEVDLTPEHTISPAELNNYQTSTATPRINTPTPEFDPTAPPLPTSTPFTYKVVSNDTLIGIAYRFGISLDTLLAANPEVDPRFLSVGADLIIPNEEGGGSTENLALPTPAKIINVSAVDC